MNSEISTGAKLFYHVYKKFSDDLNKFEGQKKFFKTIKLKLIENHSADLIKWQNNTKKMENIFNEDTLASYYPDFSIGDFHIVEHGEKKYGQLLAIYAGFSDLQAIADDTTPITEDDIRKALTALKMQLPVVEDTAPIRVVSELSEHFVSNKEIERLEFEEEGIEINCVSHSLFWASRYLPKKVRAKILLKNKYKYILTESEGVSFQGIIESLFGIEPYLREKIEIRRLYESPIVKPIAVGSVTFPLSNDIVIYKKDGEYLRTIVGANQLSSEVLPSHSVNVSEARGIILSHWFDETWKKLDPLPEIIKEVQKLK